MRKRRSRAELAVRFGVTGALGAASAVILLQQFCVLPLTERVAGGAVGGGLLGMALVGALIAGAPGGKAMPVVIPPRDRQEPERLYRFEPADDACSACKSHAEHRAYRSQEAADADRAHPGCHCEIVARPSQRAEVVAHFAGNRTVYDDRET